MALPSLQAREVTLELRNQPTDLDAKSINKTLNKIQKSLQYQLSKYEYWDKTLRIQAIILCDECSIEKTARVEYKNTTKHTRLAVCMHIQDEEANS